MNARSQILPKILSEVLRKDILMSRKVTAGIFKRLKRALKELHQKT